MQRAPEKLEEAARLYRGEFLEGFQVRAPEFEGWAATERQRLRETALEAQQLNAASEAGQMAASDYAPPRS